MKVGQVDVHTDITHHRLPRPWTSRTSYFVHRFRRAYVTENLRRLRVTSGPVASGTIQSESQSFSLEALYMFASVLLWACQWTQSEIYFEASSECKKNTIPDIHRTKNNSVGSMAFLSYVLLFTHPCKEGK